MVHIKRPPRYLQPLCGVPSAEQEKETQFHDLFSIYQNTVRYMEGRGLSGQEAVDKTYGKLLKFTADNPEFIEKLHRLAPHKVIVYDDGSGGMRHAAHDLRQRRWLLQ